MKTRIAVSIFPVLGLLCSCATDVTAPPRVTSAAERATPQVAASAVPPSKPAPLRSEEDFLLKVADAVGQPTTVIHKLLGDPQAVFPITEGINAPTSFVQWMWRNSEGETSGIVNTNAKKLAFLDFQHTQAPGNPGGYPFQAVRTKLDLQNPIIYYLPYEIEHETYGNFRYMVRATTAHGAPVTLTCNYAVPAYREERRFDPDKSSYFNQLISNSVTADKFGSATVIGITIGTSPVKPDAATSPSASVIDWKSVDKPPR